jgi:hypothetical protein
MTDPIGTQTVVANFAIYAGPAVQATSRVRAAFEVAAFRHTGLVETQSTVAEPALFAGATGLTAHRVRAALEVVAGRGADLVNTQPTLADLSVAAGATGLTAHRIKAAYETLAILIVRTVRPQNAADLPEANKAVNAVGRPDTTSAHINPRGFVVVAPARSHEHRQRQQDQPRPLRRC